MKKILLSTVALTFVLSGCVATDPYTGQTSLTNTGGGTAIGAALGGLVGAVTAEEGERGRAALRGALAARAGESVSFELAPRDRHDNPTDVADAG